MPDGRRIKDEHSSWDDFFVYNPASRHRRRLMKRLLRAHCGKIASVLDIGCGDGRLLEELRAELGASLHGIEINKSSAPERLKGDLASFHTINVEREALPHTFDLVVLSEVLEHIPDQEAALANISRMAGKYLLLTVPAGPVRKTDVLMGHLRHYTAEELAALTAKHGFRPLACFAWGFPFHSFYRFLLDVFPGAAAGGFGKPRYGFLQKAVSNLLHALFFLNSGGAGCQLFYLGEKTGS